MTNDPHTGDFGAIRITAGHAQDTEENCPKCRRNRATNQPTVFHPVQADRPPRDLPEAVALRAYEVYCHLYGAQPAMVNVTAGCRGGFSLGEIVGFLYARSFPIDQWHERFEQALERKGR